MTHELAQHLSGTWIMRRAPFFAMRKRIELATETALASARASYSDREPSLKVTGDVAVIDVCGPITYKRSWFSSYFGLVSVEDLQAQFRMALADPSVRTIAWRWDTPGGMVDFISEFADEIYAARGQKPMLSFADTMIASAGIWLASQTDTIHVSASSEVGSVGAYLAHAEYSAMLEKEGIKYTLISYGKHKVDGNPVEPLSEEALEEFQAVIDKIGGEFDGAMARGRGVTKAVVRESFGQGKMFRGKDAITAGLADKTGTFGQVVGRLTKRRGASAEVGDVAAQVSAPLAAAPLVEKSDEGVEPDKAGNCQEGYEKRDGMCYPAEGAKADVIAPAPMATDDDEAAMLAAITE